MTLLDRMNMAGQLIKEWDDIGFTPYGIEIRAAHEVHPSDRTDADIEVVIFKSGEECERIAVELLKRHPQANLIRYDDDTNFQIVCPGDPSWAFYFSDSVCEIVQTGVQIVEEPDPDLLAKVPLVKVEKPIFERRCSDLLLNIAEAAQ